MKHAVDYFKLSEIKRNRLDNELEEFFKTKYATMKNPSGR